MKHEKTKYRFALMIKKRENGKVKVGISGERQPMAYYELEALEAAVALLKRLKKEGVL